MDAVFAKHPVGAAHQNLFTTVAVCLLSVFVSAGCGKRAESNSDTFAALSAKCVSTAVPHKFIVEWKDGSISVETAPSREAFEREILEPNLKDIRHAEQDQRIRLSPYALSSLVSINQTETQRLQNWGQDRISAQAAWTQGYEGKDVIVAVVDSGVDITHLQLSGQLAINKGKIAGNGVDDDGNGFIDDINGFDFDRRSGVVKDGAGHGTHVAGIIAADPSRGSVHGVAPKAKILPLDFMDNQGSGEISNAITAMYYAASRGAKVVNASWGGAPCSEALERAILDLQSQGILFVAAAGNSGANLDANPEYPAAFGLSAQLTVGASTDTRDITAGFSNYSSTLVNLMAPGEMIYSTFPGNRAVMLDGTSMAAPFVSGAAAVLWSARPSATVAQIRDALLNSVRKGPYSASSRGRLDLSAALTQILNLVP